jgi:hypothetical protein
MHIPTRSALALATVLCTTPALAQVTFYEHDNYGGRSFTTERAIGSFTNSGFNDRASSIVVSSQMWEVCDNADFGGTCRVLRPGSYPSLTAMDLNDRISSVRLISRARPVDEERFAPLPPPREQSRDQPPRRNPERLFEANVTSVREVRRQNMNVWIVDYRFRGVDHRVRMGYDPGATVTVNRQGEPRS